MVPITFRITNSQYILKKRQTQNFHKTKIYSFSRQWSPPNGTIWSHSLSLLARLVKSTPRMICPRVCPQICPRICPQGWSRPRFRRAWFVIVWPLGGVRGTVIAAKSVRGMVDANRMTSVLPLRSRLSLPHLSLPRPRSRPLLRPLGQTQNVPVSVLV